MSKIRVLVVDDSPMFRYGMIEAVRSLAPIEMNVVGESAVGPEAIACWQTLHPDVTLLGLRMPEQVGFEVLAEIRRADPQARVVIVSECNDPELVRMALRRGATGYLVSSAGGSALLTAIRAAHSGHTYVDPMIACDLIALLYPPPHQRSASSTVGGLTEREIEVLRQVAQGLSNRAIASRLLISASTVSTHVRNILKKLQVQNRTAATLLAQEIGLSD